MMNSVFRGVFPFAVNQLFANGERGAWYDPSDLSTLFQDSAGTTPVVAAGDPVGLVLDKSGNGNNASQTITAARPSYEIDEHGLPYLSFDGIDDFLVTSSIDFTNTDKMSIFAGVRKLTDATRGMAIEFTTNAGAIQGGFWLFMPNPVSTTSVNFQSRGGGVDLSATQFGFPAPISMSANFVIDYAAGAAIMRVNGAPVRVSAATSGAFANAQLYIGRRAGTSLPFSGRFYSLIVRGAFTNNSTTEGAERYVARKTGILI